MPPNDDNNKTVSKFNPKANPVLWGYYAPLVVAWAAKVGFSLNEDDVALATTAVYLAVAWFVRHRVKPLHSDGAEVKVKE